LRISGAHVREQEAEGEEGGGIKKPKYFSF